MTPGTTAAGTSAYRAGPLPPEQYVVLSALQGAAASPVADTVRATCTHSPEKMRPNRYLRQESKQIGHDRPALAPCLGQKFSARRRTLGLACPSPNRLTVDSTISLSAPGREGRAQARPSPLIRSTSVPIVAGLTNGYCRSRLLRSCLSGLVHTTGRTALILTDVTFCHATWTIRDHIKKSTPADRRGSTGP